MKTDLLKIISHYGVNAQQRQLAEEVFELQEAITQYETITDSGLFRSSDECEAKENIVEEIADVLNLIEQFMYYYNIDFDKYVLGIKHQKVARQLERIKNE